MAGLTIRNFFDEAHRALHMGAARRSRRTAAEVRRIPRSAANPAARVEPGSLPAGAGRHARLADGKVAVFEPIRHKTLDAELRPDRLSALKILAPGVALLVAVSWLRRATAPRRRHSVGCLGRWASRRVGWLAVAPLALGFVGPLASHDLWIEPTTFRPESGGLVGAKLLVGVDLAGEPLPRHATLIDRFVYVDAAGSRQVAGRERADPAGMLRTGLPGLGVIGYQSRPSRLDLPADKFDAYLEEEGLEAIVALRRAGGHAGTREQFYRCAKSLLKVGASVEAQRDRVLGFPLELVAGRDPYAPSADGELPIRLTFEGRPLPGALVVAIRRKDDAVERLAARTDADGHVHFRLGTGGMWLIKAVHMVPVQAGANRQADWSSYWASLTFGSDDSDTTSGR